MTKSRTKDRPRSRKRNERSRDLILRNASSAPIPSYLAQFPELLFIMQNGDIFDQRHSFNLETTRFKLPLLSRRINLFALEMIHFDDASFIKTFFLPTVTVPKKVNKTIKTKTNNNNNNLTMAAREVDLANESAAANGTKKEIIPAPSDLGPAPPRNLADDFAEADEFFFTEAELANAENEGIENEDETDWGYVCLISPSVIASSFSQMSYLHKIQFSFSQSRQMLKTVHPANLPASLRDDIAISDFEEKDEDEETKTGPTLTSIKDHKEGRITNIEVLTVASPETIFRFIFTTKKQSTYNSLHYSQPVKLTETPAETTARRIKKITGKTIPPTHFDILINLEKSGRLTVPSAALCLEIVNTWKKEDCLDEKIILAFRSQFVRANPDIPFEKPFWLLLKGIRVRVSQVLPTPMLLHHNSCKVKFIKIPFPPSQIATGKIWKSAGEHGQSLQRLADSSMRKLKLFPFRRRSSCPEERQFNSATPMSAEEIKWAKKFFPGSSSSSLSREQPVGDSLENEDASLFALIDETIKSIDTVDSPQQTAAPANLTTAAAPAKPTPAAASASKTEAEKAPKNPASSPTRSASSSFSCSTCSSSSDDDDEKPNPPPSSTEKLTLSQKATLKKIQAQRKKKEEKKEEERKAKKQKEKEKKKEESSLDRRIKEMKKNRDQQFALKPSIKSPLSDPRPPPKVPVKDFPRIPRYSQQEATRRELSPPFRYTTSAQPSSDRTRDLFSPPRQVARSESHSAVDGNPPRDPVEAAAAAAIGRSCGCNICASVTSAAVSKFATFKNFRLQKLSLNKVTKWRYIGTKSNPTDQFTLSDQTPNAIQKLRDEFKNKLRENLVKLEEEHRYHDEARRRLQ